MLRLLKAARSALTSERDSLSPRGYSRRQCQRWFITYREEGFWRSFWSAGYTSVAPPRSSLPKKPSKRARSGYEKRGEIATVAQAHEFLLEKGVHYTLTPRKCRRSS